VHSGPYRWPQQPWPYHKESRRWVEQLGTTDHPINASQWPYRVCVGPAWFDRAGKIPSVKADLLIYSNCVTVSGQCLSVLIIISNKMYFNSCVYMARFPNQVTYVHKIKKHCYLYIYKGRNIRTCWLNCSNSTFNWKISQSSDYVFRYRSTVNFHKYYKNISWIYLMCCS